MRILETILSDLRQINELLSSGIINRNKWREKFDVLVIEANESEELD